MLCPRFIPSQKPIHLKGKSGPLQTAKKRKFPTENKNKINLFIGPKNTFLSQLLKDYEEASCSAVSSEPIGDLDLSDLMPETGPGNEERKFNNVGIQCDIGFVWSELRRKCVTSVGKKMAYQRNLAF